MVFYACAVKLATGNAWSLSAVSAADSAPVAARAARTPAELTIVPNKQLFTPKLLPDESTEGRLGLVAGNGQNE